MERFLKTFSRLEKHFGVARLQESFYLAPENQSREVISQMESIVHQEFPQSLTLPQFAALGIEIFGSWKSVLGIGCGMVKTSQLPLVAKDTKRPLEVFYGYSMNSSGRYVRYREIQLKTFSPNDSRASFAQTTWLMRSEAIEPFEMREDR